MSKPFKAQQVGQVQVQNAHMIDISVDVIATSATVLSGEPVVIFWHQRTVAKLNNAQEKGIYDILFAIRSHISQLRD